jgi:hypothetical protein
VANVHIVKVGENIETISKQYGFSDWRSLYNHPSNHAIRQKRPNPKNILPGDRLSIPAGAAHGKKVEFSLTVRDKYSKAPFSNLTLKLKLPNGTFKEHKTDPSGKIILKAPNITAGPVDILKISDQTEIPEIDYKQFIMKAKGLSTQACHMLEIPNKRKIINDIARKHSIVRRNSWGQIMPKYPIMEQDWDYTKIVIHHSGNGGAKRPREIESMHMTGKNPWDDVGYHFLITPDGIIHEGRYLVFKGSHVAKANTGKIGILVMGDFQHQFWDFDDDPTQKQLKSLESLLLTLKASLPTVTKLGGHRDYGSTVCPGDELYKKIPTMRTTTGLGGP